MNASPFQVPLRSRLTAGDRSGEAPRHRGLSKRHAGSASLPLDQRPSHCANLHRLAGDGKPFATLAGRGLGAAESPCDPSRIAAAPITLVALLSCGLADVTIVALGVR